MSRRMIRSTKPRKPITVPAVAAIAAPVPRPTCLWYQKYAAGLVRIAMKVAIRASLRSWVARATDSWLDLSVPVSSATSAVAIGPSV